GGDPATMQAVVTLAENADASVRLHGRRVYVDVFRRSDAPSLVEGAEPAPVATFAPVALTAPVRRAAPAAPAPAKPAPAAPAAGPAADGMEAYRAALQPLLARFEEVQSFLAGTVATASPDVLAALNGTSAQ